MALASDLSFAPFVPALPTGDDDANVTILGTVTRTLTLESATTPPVCTYGGGGNFSPSSGTTTKSATPTGTITKTAPSETADSSVKPVSGVSSTISTTSTITGFEFTTAMSTKTIIKTVHLNSSSVSFPHTECSICESTASSTIDISSTDTTYSTAIDGVITVIVTEASTTTTVVKPSQTTTNYLWPNGTTINPINGSATSTSAYVFPTPHSRNCTAITATGTLAGSYASSVSAVHGAHLKRGVCDIVTATMDDGTTIVFPNAWDGRSYVNTCSMPSSLTSTTNVPTITTSPGEISGQGTGLGSTVVPIATLPYGTLPSSSSSNSNATVTVTVISSTSDVIVPTFPSSNIVRSSSTLPTAWNATVTSATAPPLSTFATLTTRPTHSPTPDCGELGTFQITVSEYTLHFDHHTDAN